MLTFKGVTCKDISLLVDLQTLKLKNDWNEMQQSIKEISGECTFMMDNEGLSISEKSIENARCMQTGLADICGVPYGTTQCNISGTLVSGEGLDICTPMCDIDVPIFGTREGC